MKLIKKISQHRRDCEVELECEWCQKKVVDNGAYDDRNYWDNVIPARKCKFCGKSTNDMGLEIQHIVTKYGVHEII